MDTKFIKTKKERNYTVLDNSFIKDVTLSWKAKGVMAYLLSLPEDWTIHLSEIETHATDGKDSLRSALKELKEHNYLKAYQKKENGKFGEMVYIIIENPQTEIPYTENPLAEIPLSENPTLLNTNDNKVRSVKNTDNNIPKEKKQKLGTYFNVLLSDKELQKLVEKMGSEKTGAVIANFSELKEMKGYKYKSDYLAILRWGIEAYEKKNASPNKNCYVNSRRPASDSEGCDVDF